MTALSTSLISQYLCTTGMETRAENRIENREARTGQSLRFSRHFFFAPSIFQLLSSSFFFALLLSSMFYFLTSAITAAEGSRVDLKREGMFGVRVLLESREPVNAYDIVLLYDQNLVAVDGVDLGGSIMTVQPMPIKAEQGKIIIKGGSTVPFAGEQGVIASIRFRPLTEGSFSVVVDTADIYKADGQGTKQLAERTMLPLSVTRGSIESYARVSGDIRDTVPPVIVAAVIEENPLQYGEQMVIFAATDEGSGIARYEARDRSWFNWSDWREVSLPYPIDKGVWSVQLKALDYAGNDALATVYELRGALKKFGGLFVLLIILVGLLIRSISRRREVYLKSRS